MCITIRWETPTSALHLLVCINLWLFTIRSFVILYVNYTTKAAASSPINSGNKKNWSPYELGIHRTHPIRLLFWSCFQFLRFVCVCLLCHSFYCVHPLSGQFTTQPKHQACGYTEFRAWKYFYFDIENVQLDACLNDFSFGVQNFRNNNVSQRHQSLFSLHITSNDSLLFKHCADTLDVQLCTQIVRVCMCYYPRINYTVQVGFQFSIWPNEMENKKWTQPKRNVHSIIVWRFQHCTHLKCVFDFDRRNIIDESFGIWFIRPNDLLDNNRRIHWSKRCNTIA